MDTDLKSCFVFFTKGRPPIRVQAPDQIKACEKFYAQNPDFKLRELLDIREATLEKKHPTLWLKGVK
jgi:hypothetical protein